MVKLVLLKRPAEGTSRAELIEYLKTVHGPRIASLPNIREYTLSVQVDPDEEELLEGLDYYDSSETIPTAIKGTAYDTIEIHEFDSMNDLLEAHTSEQAEEGLHDIIDFEDEIAFVVRDEPIGTDRE